MKKSIKKLLPPEQRLRHRESLRTKHILNKIYAYINIYILYLYYKLLKAETSISLTSPGQRVSRIKFFSFLLQNFPLSANSNRLFELIGYSTLANLLSCVLLYQLIIYYKLLYKILILKMFKLFDLKPSKVLTFSMGNFFGDTL